MASIETGKELMEDSLKHIDELFRSHLGSAGVTPPAGVFEQCVQQLQSSGTEGQGLNQGATQNGVQSGVGNAVGSAGKTIFGFSLKASVAILGTVVATVLVVSAIMQKNASINNTKEAPTSLSETAQAAKAIDVISEGNASNNDKYNASTAPTNSNIVERPSQGKSTLGKSKWANSAVGSDYEETTMEATKNNGDVKNTGGTKSVAGIGNTSNAPREKLANGILVNGSGDNLNQSSRLQKATATTTSNPCEKNGNQWKPVLSDIIGGIVSLGIEGKYEKIRVDWADGERPEIVTDQVGVERVSHQYWVNHAKTFSVKMLNERRVLDERGMLMICKDSQRVAVNISPTSDATDIFVPDIFTPNDDGLNEEFYIVMAQPQIFDICVFDLNNRLIFRSDKYDEKWKGTCGSSLCPEGVYRVVVSYKYSGNKSFKYARKSVKLIYKTTP